MGTEGHIVFKIDSRSNKSPADITKDINSVSYDELSGKYTITFISGKTYEYDNASIMECRRLDAADYSDKVLVTSKGTTLTNVISVECFYEIHTQVKLFLVTFKNGSSKGYRENELSFIDKEEHRAVEAARRAKIGDKGVFQYLCRVCELTRPTNPNFVDYYTNQYYDVASLHPNKVALGGYIDPENYPFSKYDEPDEIIYPFGLNLSQTQAVKNALTNQMSIIEGPPGTGKTQTILNIIANLVINGKTILVVSPNNLATDNIIEKLDASGYGFLVARLGRSTNIKEFQASEQTGQYPEEIAAFRVDDQQIDKLKNTLTKKVDQLSDLLEKQRAYRTHVSELENYRLQQSYLAKEHPEIIVPNHRPRTNSKQIKKVYDYMRKLGIQSSRYGYTKKVTILRKLQFWLIEGVGDLPFYKQPLGLIEQSLFSFLLEAVINEKAAELNSLQTFLSSSEPDSQVAIVTDLSNQLFRGFLSTKYNNETNRTVFAQEKEMDIATIRREYPIVTSTIDAALTLLGQGNHPYDYVIVDESSQATIVKGALALASAKNAVVVGDTKQLGPIIDDKNTKELNKLLLELKGQEYKHYSYKDHSLLSSLLSLSTNENYNIPTQMLREHYRSDPRIISFCNEKFYAGELIYMKDSSKDVKDVLKVIYSEGLNLDRVGDYNRRQAEDFAGVLSEWLQEYTFDEIGVVTPYRSQVAGMIADKRFNGGSLETELKIDTVHKYQGREKNAIAFITVRNGITQFLDQPNLINVAVSRAKESLAVITSGTLIDTSGDITNNISELVRYIQYQGGELRVSSVSSIYDVLYNEEETLKVIEGFPDAVKTDSSAEIITIQNLQRIIHKNELHGTVAFQLHYPLSLLFREPNRHSDMENNYIKNEAHVDMIVYLKSDKRALFGLEVNGSMHYKKSRKQQERDSKKEELFRKYDLPLYILPTHGSGEADRIEEALLTSIKSSTSSNKVEHMPVQVMVPIDDALDEWYQNVDISSRGDSCDSSVYDKVRCMT